MVGQFEPLNRKIERRPFEKVTDELTNGVRSASARKPWLSSNVISENREPEWFVFYYYGDTAWNGSKDSPALKCGGKAEAEFSRRYERNKAIKEGLEALEMLEGVLGEPEAAMYVHFFKESLKKVWEYIDVASLASRNDREIAMAVGAIESAVMGIRWKDYKPHHILLLKEMLGRCMDALDIPDIRKMLSQMMKTGIDILPSASDDEE